MSTDNLYHAPMNPKNHPLDQAAKFLGSNLVGLSCLLGVTKSAVSQWKQKERSVPVKHCLAIEKLTQGAVTRRDLRPDDFHELWPDIPLDAL